MKTGNNSRKGDRQIVSVAIPVTVYETLTLVVEHFNISRSELITRAIRAYLHDLGAVIGREVK